MARARLIGITLGSLLALGCSAPDEMPAPTEVIPAPPTLHRLTRTQYQETLRSLFGDGIKLPEDLEVDTPLHGFTSIGASELTIPPRAAEQYEAASYDVAHQVWSSADQRRVLLGENCTPRGTDDPCVREFLASFGRRAFRRPIESAELDTLQALANKLFTTLGNVQDALEYTLASFLQSPHFLFRVEIGEPDPDRPGRLRYTGLEMASRLSYLIWNTMPDGELLSAAERGELSSREGVRIQAERMMATPTARRALGGFFAEYFNLPRLDTVTKDKAMFPSFTPSLMAAMREEISRDVEDVIFTRDADYRELFQSRETYVNGELAKLYGVERSGTDYARIELPAGSKRGGLLGTAGILALNAHATTTSPTHRGKFVRGYLLCQEIPPPPPGVVTTLEPPVGMNTTLRQRLERHRDDPACRSCHQMMDPIGLGLENFDAIGAFRTLDSGLPIDASADLDGKTFDGAAGLGQALVDDVRLGPCLARQLYRHATGHIEEAVEQDGITQLGATFSQQQFRFQKLVIELVQSDGFRLASTPPTGEGG